MATRNAQVKLTLDSGEYLTELKKLGQISDKEFERMRKDAAEITEGMKAASEATKKLGEEAKDAAEKSAQGTSRFQRGADAAKESFTRLGSKVKDVATAALTLGGALSVGSMVHETIDLQSRMVQLQNSIERTGGGLLELSDIQGRFEEAAQDSNRSTKEMVDALDAAKEAGAGVDEAFDDLSSIGVAMSATGRSAEEMGRLAGSIRKQFPGADVESALAMIIGKADETGLTIEELSEDFSEMGSIAKQAGLDGEDGLAMVIGIAGEANKDVKNMAETLTGLDQVFEKMRQTPVLEGLAESAGIAEKDVSAAGNAVERVGKLLELSAAKGEKKFDAFKKLAMQEEFTGREEKAAFEALSKPFDVAYQTAIDSGKSAKEAAAEGAKAFEDSVKKMAKSNTTWADLQEQAAREAETPAAKLRQALEKVQLSFQKPEMISAIEKLADSLPKLADMIASVVSFAAENPLTAGVGAVAGYGGLNFAQAALMGGGGFGLGGAAKGTDSASAVGNAAKKGVSSGMAGWGAKIGAVAAPIMAAAVAGAIAKELIDSAISSDKKLQEENVKATVTAAQAMYSNDPKQIQAAIKATEKQIAETKDAGPSRARRIFDNVLESAGLLGGSTYDASGERVDTKEGFQASELDKSAGRHVAARVAQEEDLGRLKARLMQVQARERFKKQDQEIADMVGDKGGKATGPSKVQLEKPELLAQELARGITQKELRVTVTNMPGAGFSTAPTGTGGSRGPLSGGPSGSGSSVGGA